MAIQLKDRLGTPRIRPRIHHTHPKVDITCLSLSRVMDKQSVHRTMECCCARGEKDASQVHDSTDMTPCQGLNCTDRKQTSGCQALTEGLGWAPRGRRHLWGRAYSCMILTVVTVPQVHGSQSAHVYQNSQN